MTTAELKKILQSPYKRENWRRVLRFIDGNRNLLKPHLNLKELKIKTETNRKTVKEFREIGKLQTADGVELPLFEVVLNAGIKIERNRIGVNDFIKNHILKDAVKGALATFTYGEKSEQSEWRFSFISKNSASEFFAEAEEKETNPKKFTYIFGNPEQHRTAIERLYDLKQSRFTLNDFFDAFNVAPISNRFFEDYGKFHKDFSTYIIENNTYSKVFENPNNIDLDLKREIRNFVNRLMGRVVFLYFLQKKRWLGATSTKYDDGSPTFLSDIFEADAENQDDFYNKYLCPIFFNGLNSSDRSNDEFVLKSGKTVCIPFLNGGLFEENQEPKGHREIKFPTSYFNEFFEFLNSFNFTIYENSPEENTVAVDPEMLGHIFESLIDYNKNTGTFYTPKEIVQYMTRESLIEYLHTHIDKSGKKLRNMVQNHNVNGFSKVELEKIDFLMDKVKICDPAVGSGAFPMGMLLEIFNLKELLSFKLCETDWNPVKTKKKIIYNSIYGVDLDEGAIEIAQLRFWLSFVVDEKKPQALPNLDYKIMQGNSLVESFRGIDLTNLGRIDEPVINEQQILDLGEQHTKITVFDSVSLDEIRGLIEEYFDANNRTKRKKKQIKKDIDDIIEGKIHNRIFMEKETLKNEIDKFYKKYNIQNRDFLEEYNPKSRDVKQFKKNKKKLEQLKTNEQELISFQKNNERPYFLWNLFFSEVLENGGFDIVIANPPYIKEYTNRTAFDEFREMSKYYRGKMDIWYGFASVGLDLLKENGVECFIAQNNWVTSAGASILRKDVLKRTEIKQFLDFGDYKVFQSAGIQTMVYLLQKKKNPAENYKVYYAGLNKSTIHKNQLTDFLDQNKEKSNEKIFEKYVLQFHPADYKNTFISFIRPSIQSNLNRFIEKKNFELKKKEVIQGIVGAPDKCFVIDANSVNNFDIAERKFLKPYYTNSSGKTDKYIFYFSKNNFEKENLKDYPNIEKHFLKYKDKLKKSKVKYKTPNKPYFYLHRAREKYFFDFGAKIIGQIRVKKPSFLYVEDEYYVSRAANIIKTKRINLKYLTLFLNSSLINFYYRYKGANQGDILKFDKGPLLKIPIHKPDSYFPFIELFELVTATLQADKKILEAIDNKHIAGFFEEVADACFFDIYFLEEMKEKDISVMEEIQEKIASYGVTESFGQLEWEKQKETLADLYMALKESKAQQKMRRFVTASPDVLRPILQS